ncbi:lysoplasmalogenase [Sedimentimonas flavescens]|uniref:lysoplasmalogenase n=1 Tax=Sedimentimonas flavescens TaxID=2851012 RepID=UPI001C4A3BC2|nr:lysoplasmalogenase [Sedimentimonas flavescens]MBW0158820.1 lysoplasmalogenase [Sedimentimonas flavescens]
MMEQLLVSFAALLAVWQFLAFATAPSSLRKSVVKTGSVAALALAAPMLGAPWTVALGLALGAVGDWFLSRDGERAFLLGMAAFAAGHASYVAAFIAMGAGVPGWPVIVALVLLGASTEFWLAPRTGALRWPVRGYVLVILAMSLAALGMEGRAMLRAGAVLFVASDLVLAVQIFVLADGPLRRACQRLLWVLYWCGQVLILWGAV